MRNIFLLLLCAVLTMTFVSCKKDRNEYAESMLIGEWKTDFKNPMWKHFILKANGKVDLPEMGVSGEWWVQDYVIMQNENPVNGYSLFIKASKDIKDNLIILSITTESMELEGGKIIYKTK